MNIDAAPKSKKKKLKKTVRRVVLPIGLCYHRDIEPKKGKREKKSEPRMTKGIEEGSH